MDEWRWRNGPKSLLAGLGSAAALLSPAIAKDLPVKVYILAGQSNMEGKAQNKLLEHQATDAKTKEQFAHLRKDGEWIVRDDVMIKYLERHGGLTIGYGSRGRTGAELEFGNTMGDHYEQPVLLIKTAWGGHSLYQKFRSPAAGLPSDEKLAEELKKAQERTTKNNEKRKKSDPLPTMEDVKAGYGVSYREMMKEVKETTENFKDPAVVHVSVKGLKFKVELPLAYHGKAEAGWKTWIGLVGTCRLEPQGGPMTAEQWDGSIEVGKIAFLNQENGHRKSLKIRR